MSEPLQTGEPTELSHQITQLDSNFSEQKLQSLLSSTQHDLSSLETQIEALYTRKNSLHTEETHIVYQGSNITLKAKPNNLEIICQKYELQQLLNTLQSKIESLEAENIELKQKSAVSSNHKLIESSQNAESDPKSNQSLQSLKLYITELESKLIQMEEENSELNRKLQAAIAANAEVQLRLIELPVQIHNFSDKIDQQIKVIQKQVLVEVPVPIYVKEYQSNYEDSSKKIELDLLSQDQKEQTENGSSAIRQNFLHNARVCESQICAQPTEEGENLQNKVSIIGMCKSIKSEEIDDPLGAEMPNAHQNTQRIFCSNAPPRQSYGHRHPENNLHTTDPGQKGGAFGTNISQVTSEDIKVSYVKSQRQILEVPVYIIKQIQVPGPQRLIYVEVPVQNQILKEAQVPKETLLELPCQVRVEPTQRKSPPSIENHRDEEVKKGRIQPENEWTQRDSINHLNIKEEDKGIVEDFDGQSIFQKEHQRLVSIPVEVVVEVPVFVQKLVEVPVERIVHVPVETIRYMTKEVLREVPIQIVREVVKEVEAIKEVEVLKEIIVEVPTQIERIVQIQKEVIKEIPYEVEIKVEKEVYVDRVETVEVIREVPIEMPIEKIVHVEIPTVVQVVKLVELPIENYIEKPSLVEVVKLVEVPVQSQIEGQNEVGLQSEPLRSEQNQISAQSNKQSEKSNKFVLLQYPVETILEREAASINKFDQKHYEVQNTVISSDVNPLSKFRSQQNQKPIIEDPVQPQSQQRALQQVTERLIQIPIENTVIDYVETEKLKILEIPVQNLIPASRNNSDERNNKRQMQQQVVVKYVEVPVQNIVQKEVRVVIEKQVVKEVEVERIVDREVPVFVEKIVNKEVQVPIQIEKIINRLIEIPIHIETQVVVEVEKIIQKLIQIPCEVEIENPDQSSKAKIVQIEVPVEVQKIVQKTVEVQVPIQIQVPVEVEKVVYVEKVIERLLEVPVEVEVMKQKIIEVLVEQPIIIEIEKEIQIQRPVSVIVKQYVDRIVEVEKTVYTEIPKIEHKEDSPLKDKVSENQSDSPEKSQVSQGDQASFNENMNLDSIQNQISYGGQLSDRSTEERRITHGNDENFFGQNQQPLGLLDKGDPNNENQAVIERLQENERRITQQSMYLRQKLLVLTESVLEKDQENEKLKKQMKRIQSRKESLQQQLQLKNEKKVDPFEEKFKKQLNSRLSLEKQINLLDAKLISSNKLKDESIAELKKLQNDHQQLLKDIDSLSKNLRQKQSEIDSFERQLEEKIEQLNDANSSSNILGEHLRASQSQEKLLREQNRKIEDEVIQLRARLEEIQLNHQESKEEIHNEISMELQENFIRNEKEKIEKCYKKQIESILTKYTGLVEENKKQIRELDSRIAQLQRENSVLRSKSRSNDKPTKSPSAKQEKVHEENRKLIKIVESLTQQNEKIKKKLHGYISESGSVQSNHPNFSFSQNNRENSKQSIANSRPQMVISSNSNLEKQSKITIEEIRQINSDNYAKVDGNESEINHKLSELIKEYAAELQRKDNDIDQMRKLLCSYQAAIQEMERERHQSPYTSMSRTGEDFSYRKKISESRANLDANVYISNLLRKLSLCEEHLNRQKNEKLKLSMKVRELQRRLEEEVMSRNNISSAGYEEDEELLQQVVFELQNEKNLNEEHRNQIAFLKEQISKYKYGYAREIPWDQNQRVSRGQTLRVHQENILDDTDPELDFYDSDSLLQQVKIYKMEYLKVLEWNKKLKANILNLQNELQGQNHQVDQQVIRNLEQELFDCQNIIKEQEYQIAQLQRETFKKTKPREQQKYQSLRQPATHINRESYADNLMEEQNYHISTEKSDSNHLRLQFNDDQQQEKICASESNQERRPTRMSSSRIQDNKIIDSSLQVLISKGLSLEVKYLIAIKLLDFGLQQIEKNCYQSLSPEKIYILYFSLHSPQNMKVTVNSSFKSKERVKHFQAPEILTGENETQRSYVWSFGLILDFLFHEKLYYEKYADLLARKDNYKFLSQEAADVGELVELMVVKDKRKRISLQEAYEGMVQLIS